jgi:hypothetical protein
MGILVHVKTKSREPNCSFQPVQVGNVPENVGPKKFSSSQSQQDHQNKWKLEPGWGALQQNHEK